MTNTITRLPITLGSFCEARHLTALGTNLAEIRRCLGEMNYDISGVPSVMPTITVATHPKLLQSLFNTVDTRIWQMTQTTDYLLNAYLDYQYQWVNRPIDIKVQILRWFAWSNQQKGIIDNAEVGTQPLCDINRELTTDINGDIIYVEAE